MILVDAVLVIIRQVRMVNDQSRHCFQRSAAAQISRFFTTAIGAS
jgi:hypothetical protein